MSIRKLDPSEDLWLNDLGREEVEKQLKHFQTLFINLN